MDNSLYPILFLDSLILLFGPSDGDTSNDDFGSSLTPLARMSFVLSVTAVLSYINYRGLDIVGNIAIILCVVSLLPFIGLLVCSSNKLDPKRWLDGPEDGIRGVDWRLLLNTFFWNVRHHIPSYKAQMP